MRDPLKGWARKDTTLPDTFSIEQPVVDGTCSALELLEMFRPAWRRCR
jgi:hypothetical protein